MNIDEAMKYAQNALEMAFENWLETERPSGDCESVHRQWDDSFAHQELVDELQPVMALTWEVRRLHEENERLRKDAEKHDAMPVRYVSLQHIKTKVTDANPNPVQVNVISERNGAWLDMPREKIDVMRTEMQAAIDAARGAK